MSQPIEPLQQATITIAGCALPAVLLPDGQPAIAFTALCEALSLAVGGPATAIPEPVPQRSPWQALHAALDELEGALAADMDAVTERVTVLEGRVVKTETEAYYPVALTRLLAATIERLLEHERRLNGLKLRTPQQARRAGGPTRASGWDAPSGKIGMLLPGLFRRRGWLVQVFFV